MQLKMFWLLITRLGYARITHGGLSDTEVQIAKFHIPDNPDNYKDNTRLTTDPSKVDSHVHFNKRWNYIKVDTSSVKRCNSHWDKKKTIIAIVNCYC